MGLVAVLLGLFGAALERPWPTDDTLPTFLAANRLAVVGQSLFFMAGAAFNLWFVAGLREHLVASSPRARRLAHLVFGAGLLWSGLNIIGQAPQIVLSLPSQAHVSPALARALADLCFVMLNVANLPLAVMFAALATLTFRARVFPLWLGGLAAFAAVAAALLVLGLALGTGPLAPQGWLTILLYPASVLWLVPASIYLLVRQRRLHAPVAAR